MQRVAIVARPPEVMALARRPSLPAAWLGLAVGVLVLCGAPSCRIADPEHCANLRDAQGRTMHAWCEANASLAYCDPCLASAAGHFGCTDRRPSEDACVLSMLPAPVEGSSTGEASSSGEVPGCTEQGWSEACASVDSQAPYCEQGQCIDCQALCPAPQTCAPLPSGTCVECLPDEAQACPPQSPRCSPALACTASCDRHAQCPASACDLATGSCMPEAGSLAIVDPLNPTCRELAGGDWSLSPVVYCDVSTALASAATQVSQAAIVVEPRTPPYGVLDVPAGLSVAILGATDADQAPVFRASSASAPTVVSLAPTGRLYLQGVVVSGVASELTTALRCEDAELWLDEVEVRANHVGVGAQDCDVHVVRSSIHDNTGEGVEVLGGALWLDSSVIALNGGSQLRVEEAAIDIRASDLLGGLESSPANLECGTGVVGVLDGVIALSDAIGQGQGIDSIACDTVDLLRTVTEASFADGHPGLAEVFSEPTRGELADNGQALSSAWRAPWVLGDPYFDIDGEPRPSPQRPLVLIGANEPSP